MFKRICEHCGRRIPVGVQPLKTETGFICEDCAPFYKPCSICGKFILREKDINYCKECNDKIYISEINNYSTKPNPLFKNFGTDDRSYMGKRYYGLEMEFSYLESSRAYKIFKEQHENKLLYNKSDGSIHGGTEIVTVPLDRRSAKELIESMDKGLKEIRETCCDYKEGSGIHIHVNKETIDPIDRYKLSILLNKKKFTSWESDLIYFLAGRCESTSKDFCEHYCTVGSSNIMDYKRISDRHIALNILNKETFEFRIFKSSTYVEEILSYIYIVDTMIEFCHNNGINDITVSNYVLFLKRKNDNKLIMDKIKEFENNRHKIIKDCNFIDNGLIYKELSGINVTSYYKILNNIPASVTNRDLYKIILDYKKGVKNKLNYQDIISSAFSNNSIVKEMNKKLKDYILNRIREVEAKCA